MKIEPQAFNAVNQVMYYIYNHDHNSFTAFLQMIAAIEGCTEKDLRRSHFDNTKGKELAMMDLYMKCSVPAKKYYIKHCVGYYEGKVYDAYKQRL